MIGRPDLFWGNLVRLFYQAMKKHASSSMESIEDADFLLSPYPELKESLADLFAMGHAQSMAKLFEETDGAQDLSNGWFFK